MYVYTKSWWLNPQKWPSKVFGGFLVMGVPQIIQVMDATLVLKAMVTWGCPILRNTQTIQIHLGMIGQWIRRWFMMVDLTCKLGWMMKWNARRRWWFDDGHMWVTPKEQMPENPKPSQTFPPHPPINNTCSGWSLKGVLFGCMVRRAAAWLRKDCSVTSWDPCKWATKRMQVTPT